MTDTYEINFSQMSDNLTSIVDTKYGTLDSIQKNKPKHFLAEMRTQA